jgi:hypothetical protein
MTNLSRESGEGHDASVAGVTTAARVSGVGAASTWWGAFVADMAPQDWMIFVYFLLLLLGVVFGAGPDRMLAGRIVVVHIVAVALGLALTRGGVIPRQTFACSLVYRLTLFFTVMSSYFQLRIILPAAAPRSVDATLYAIDQAVFHYEPALAWDRFVTPATTEWFAFFYFGYFFILALHVLPFMLIGRDMTMLARFSTAIFFVFCAGHLLYIVVPGYGPHRFLEGRFAHELDGGLFWGLVKATVAAEGAQKDIFPSLHTGIPSMFTILAFKYRRAFRPFWYSAPVIGFCTSQIIVATMFLRWHYLIDICAGLALAFLAVAVADRAVLWDDARRARRGLAPAWTPLTLSSH